MNGQHTKCLETIEMMIRIDKISSVEIIETCNRIENHWYGSNIQSIQNLRAKKDGLTKFDRFKNYIEKEKNVPAKKENEKDFFQDAFDRYDEVCELNGGKKMYDNPFDF